MKNWQKRLIIVVGICAAIWMIGRLEFKIGSFGAIPLKSTEISQIIHF